MSENCITKSPLKTQVMTVSRIIGIFASLLLLILLVLLVNDFTVMSDNYISVDLYLSIGFTIVCFIVMLFGKDKYSEYIKSHKDTVHKCPNCNSKNLDEFYSQETKNAYYQYYNCNECHADFSVKNIVLSKYDY